MKSTIIQLLENKIINNLDEIKGFFVEKFKIFPPIIYNSIDLRHSGFKIAPVDTNCFPAGFNNIKGKYQQLAQDQAYQHIKKFHNLDKIKNIAIIAESHTRNLQYLSSLNSLLQIFNIPNTKTHICTLNPEVTDFITLKDADGKEIKITKLQKSDRNLTTQDQKIDLAILNNDLTNYFPNFFENLDTPVIPSPKIGWHNRSKFSHFQIYNKLCEELCQILDIDPWLISGIQSHAPSVNFKEGLGLDEIANQAAIVLSQIQQKYNQYSIKQNPFCYIKADNGTYGMAVTQIFHPEEILNLNKKLRNKMNMLKEHKHNSSVKIQEGIPSIDKIQQNTCEPLIYMISGEVSAFLSRSHEAKDQYSSLNSPGAQFFNLEEVFDKEIGGNIESVKKVYWLVSKLASLSCSIEISNLN